MKPAVFALVALLLLPSALAAGTIPPGGEAAPVQLNWIGHWKGEDRREELVHELRREYEFLHPNVKINLVFNKDLPGPDPDYKRRSANVIVDMIRTGATDWDIVYLDIGVYELVTQTIGSSSWAAEHFVDFGQVPGFPQSQEDFILADPWYRTRMGGIFTGPYIENYLLIPWYNSRVAQRTGIAVKERGMTLDDLAGYAERLSRYNAANGTAIPLIKLHATSRIDVLFESLFRSQFDDFPSALEERLHDGKLRAFRRTLEAFERLSRFQPAVNRGWEQVTAEAAKREMIQRDDALFIFGGTFNYSHFRGIDPVRCEGMRPVENPVLGRANGLIGDFIPAFAVPKKARNRDTAVDFLMSWSTPKTAEKWVRYTKNPTGVRGAFSDVVSHEADAFGDVYERYLGDMRRTYRGVPMRNLRTPTYVFGKENPVSADELRSKLGAILEGRLTAADYYEDVMRRLRRNGP